MSLLDDGLVRDNSMRPPKGFVQSLQSYDPRLGVEFVKCSVSGDPILRWRVYRLSEKDGRKRHIMFVVGDGPRDEETGLPPFRPLDSRVIDKLAKCDSHRFYRGRGNMSDAEYRAFMNNLGMKGDEADQFASQLDDMADRRYSAMVEELADRLIHAAKSDPQLDHLAGNSELTELALERTEVREEVEDAYEKGRGVIEWDPDLGAARKVSDG